MSEERTVTVVVRMPMAPPPHVVVEFMWRGRVMTSRLSRVGTGRAPLYGAEVWCASKVWCASRGDVIKMGIRLRPGESVVTIDDGVEVVSQHAQLLALRLVPRQGEVVEGVQR